ncbi:GIY-YIG nuclease family protein [Streptomyces sp. NPDC060209]|uniref:GIY-YIG nuclease family protein n=1 Tax=Streptomyces sp. NPDC060209 TaxID=3347073 RepID=UPI0036696C31
MALRTAPHPGLVAGRLLYVGIAPRYMANRTSTQNLRKRVRYHFRGNAAGSTLRLTLGCLLGLELRRVGGGKRMTFGKEGEAALSQWMAENARECPNVLDRACRTVVHGVGAHLLTRPAAEPRPEPPQRFPSPALGVARPSAPACTRAVHHSRAISPWKNSGDDLKQTALSCCRKPTQTNALTRAFHVSSLAPLFQGLIRDRAVPRPSTVDESQPASQKPMASNLVRAMGFPCCAGRGTVDQQVCSRGSRVTRRCPRLVATR